MDSEPKALTLTVHNSDLAYFRNLSDETMDKFALNLTPWEAYNLCVRASKENNLRLSPHLQFLVQVYETVKLADLDPAFKRKVVLYRDIRRAKNHHWDREVIFILSNSFLNGGFPQFNSFQAFITKVLRCCKSAPFSMKHLSPYDIRSLFQRSTDATQMEYWLDCAPQSLAVPYVGSKRCEITSGDMTKNLPFAVENASLMARLISQGADPLARFEIDRKESTLFMFAAEKSNPVVLRLLLSNGAGKSVVNEKSYALRRAIIGKNVANVQCLLQHGVDPNDLNIGGTSSIILAVGSKSVEIVRLVLEHGANPNIFKRRTLPALLYACNTCQSEEIVGELLAHGAAINHQSRLGQTALMLAVINSANDNTKIVELLLANNCDIDLQNQKGETAVSLARTLGKLAVIHLFIKFYELFLAEAEKC